MAPGVTSLGHDACAGSVAVAITTEESAADHEIHESGAKFSWLLLAHLVAVPQCVVWMDCEEQAAVHKLSTAVSELEREAARLQDKTGAIGDIQRSLVTIASAWHACLDRAAWSSAPDTQ